MRQVFVAPANHYGAELLRYTNAESWLITHWTARSFDGPQWRRVLNAVEASTPSRPRLMIYDSGAFTAWSTGGSVDLDQLRTAAVAATERLPELHVVNLDVIPGAKGRASTQAEREDGMAQSLANADRLRTAGLRVMEVYHQDEPTEFLWELLGRRKPGELLGVSPRNDTATPTRVRWLQWLLAVLVDRYGPAGLPPCHGLAATSPKFNQVFPFFSSDSMSWMASVMYGKSSDQLGRRADTAEFFYRRPGASTRAGTSKEHRGVEYLPMRAEIRRTLAAERSVTEMWSRRGVVWGDTVP